MLDDEIREYEKTKKMLKNTPAMYKREYPFLKEVDSLALANVQLHLEKAYKNFFRDPKTGFPRFKSKHHSRNSYTTNVVNQWLSVWNHPENTLQVCCMKDKERAEIIWKSLSLWVWKWDGQRSQCSDQHPWRGKKDVDSIDCPYPDNQIIRKYARVRAKESRGTRG